MYVRRFPLVRADDQSRRSVHGDAPTDNGEHRCATYLLASRALRSPARKFLKIAVDFRRRASVSSSDSARPGCSERAGLTRSMAHLIGGAGGIKKSFHAGVRSLVTVLWFQMYTAP